LNSGIYVFDVNAISVSSSAVNNTFTIAARKVMDNKNMSKRIQASFIASTAASSYAPSYARGNENSPIAGRVSTVRMDSIVMWPGKRKHYLSTWEHGNVSANYFIRTI
jgi:hypothetical protein